jgi:nitric oxide reductase NorE protein
MSTTAGELEPFPVEAGVWVIVLGELCVFTLFFVTFLYYRAFSPEVFEASRITLSQGLGAFNTLLLLTSSWFVASAVRALCGFTDRRKALHHFVGAFICGVAFVLVKIFEYGSAFSDGVNVLTDDFFMFYFMLTGIHLLHLLVGMTLLGAMILHLKGTLAANGEISQTLVGFSSCFWHMLDLVWIVLFPLLYLLR